MDRGGHNNSRRRRRKVLDQPASPRLGDLNLLLGYRLPNGSATGFHDVDQSVVGAAELGFAVVGHAGQGQLEEDAPARELAHALRVVGAAAGHVDAALDAGGEDECCWRC